MYPVRPKADPTIIHNPMKKVFKHQTLKARVEIKVVKILRGFANCNFLLPWTLFFPARALLPATGHGCSKSVGV
ncbi:hypothetical protein V6N13_064737 [Hibiscus sabdariffa]